MVGNSVSFFTFFDKAEICKTSSSFLDLLSFTGEIDFDPNTVVFEKQKHFYNDDYVLDFVFENPSFDDVKILGITFFEHHGFLLCLVGLFLLIATIVSVILCLNVFN